MWKISYKWCGRKLMRLATLCTNRQGRCLPLHMAVRLTSAVLCTSLNLLQLLRDCWESLKWSCVCEVRYENGPAKVGAKLCHQILCKAWRIRYCDLWKVTKGYGEHSLSRAQVFRWHKSFLEGREQVEEEPRAGRPSTSKTDNNVERVRSLVRSDRRLTSTLDCHLLSINMENDQ